MRGMPIDEIIGKRDLRLTFFHVFLLTELLDFLFYSHGTQSFCLRATE